MSVFKSKKESPKSCSQCGNQPMYQFQGHLLCLSCYERVHQIEQENLHNLFIMHNRAAASMENALGMTGMVARYNVPTPNVFSGNINDIKISNSTVGSVNTGRIENLNNTMNNINVPNSEEFLNRIKEFVEAVLSSEMTDTAKNEIVEQVDTILAEVNSPSEKKKPGVIRVLVDNIKDSLTVGNGLYTMWDNIQKIIGSLL
ncbi:hypothetical protein ACFQZE_11720 [Paenibacillus sp. GCM10027627]|uniref:hypothetical protein n=1 Tax=unclassified Paenibacillus TaxID=185978 RepID=UPI0036279A0D